MKMRKNRMLGILLSFMLVLGSMAGSIMPVYADDIIQFDLFGLCVLKLSGSWHVDNTPLNGKQISGNGWKYDGKSTVSGNGWTLDLDTFTVTLDGLDYKGSAKGIAFYGPDSLTLNLKGVNSINTTRQCGIESGKGLEINGPGSLSVTSSDYSYCVYAESNLLVNGGKITVTGTDTSTGAIHCNSLTVSGGDLTAEATASYNNIGILASENVVVSSGSLTAKGGDSAQGKSYGIWLGGVMTIEDGIVDAMAGSAPHGESFAISTGTEQNVISGGTVTAAASDAYESIGLDCWSLKVTNGTVTATSGNSQEYRSNGIRCASQMEINGGTVIASAGRGKYSYGINAANHYIMSGIQYVEARGYNRGVYGELHTQVNAVGWTDYEGTYGDQFLRKGDYGYDHFGKNVDKRNVQFPDVVSVPVFSLPGGAYNKAQSVTLTSATRGADIYYTTDGTDPSLQNGKKYTGPITVAVSTTIKAIAVKRGLSDSGVVTEEYKLPAPSITTVTINSKTVTANSLRAAVAQAGARSDTVTTIVLGKKVSKISKGAFVNYKKAKTLEVRTKKLKKASVKNSLKGSHITKVKVKIGNKKTNKSYVKKYKKIFSKKNSGRSVKVTL